MGRLFKTAHFALALVAGLSLATQGCKQVQLIDPGIYNQTPDDPNDSSNNDSDSDSTPSGPAPLYIRPSTVLLLPDETLTFTSSGAQGELDYAVQSGPGSINRSNGSFIAPSSVGLTTVSVTDGLGREKTADVRVGEWSTSELLAPAESSWNMAHGIAATSTGVLYAAGEMAKGTNGVKVWVVRKSTNDGLTWSDVDNFQLDPEGEAVAAGIYISSTNEIFVYGSAAVPLHNSYGIIRYSNDGGSSWTTLDQFQYKSDKNTSWSSFVKDINGNMWIVGAGSDFGNKLHWITRKSANRGQTWTTVDDYSTAGSYAARGVAADSTGSVYVLGDGDGIVVVRKSTDGGTTWRTDDFVLVENETCLVHTSNHPIAIDSKNNVYYTYRCADATTSPPIPGGIRKFDPEAGVWSLEETVGMYLHSGNIFIDANDIVYVVGRVYDSVVGYSNGYWIIKASRDMGFSWQTLGRYQAAAADAEPHSVCVSPTSGNLFVAGWAWNGPLYWVIRKFGL